MLASFLLLQAWASRRNAVRPIWCLVSPPCAQALFSSTDWVAMPAWSQPGTHTTFRCCMRCQRTSVSCMATVRAWPRCRSPVMLGGGSTMLKDPLVASWAFSSRNSPLCSHHSNQPDSTNSEL
uniref:Putative secreted protein n=1 Tax=Ixodes ricinus TaxID=34613 RepID=A0A6B0UNH6_IXORI